jgi:hypothetical protein
MGEAPGAMAGGVEHSAHSEVNCGDRARSVFSGNFWGVDGNKLNRLICGSRHRNANRCPSFIARLSQTSNQRRIVRNSYDHFC